MNARAQPSLLAYVGDCIPLIRALRMQPKRQSGALGRTLMVLGLVASAAGMVTGVVMGARTWLGWSGALTLLAGMLLATWGGSTLVNLVAKGALQNTPANAVLVPRLNRLMRRSALLLWVATMAGVALIGAVIPFGVVAPLIVHSIFVATLWGGMLGLSLAAMACVMLGPLLAQPWIAAWADTPAMLAAAYAVSLWCGWRALAWAFPRGGERHLAQLRRARQGEQAQRAMSGLAHRQFSTQPGRGAPIARRMLAADIARGHPARLMLLALGPGNHRFDSWPIMLLFGAIALTAKLIFQTWWPQVYAAMAPTIALSSMGGIAGMALATPCRLVVTVPNRAAEQALFRLAPAAPGALELNRMLAKGMLRVCLLDWAGVLLLMLAVSFMWGATPMVLLGQWTLMCAVLAAAGWPLRDYARDPRTPYWITLPIIALVLGAAALAFMIGAHAWLWALLLAVSVGIIRRRYRAMLAAPVAFPAGRLGN